MPNTGKEFEKFIQIVKTLRQKCPWDREQTMESLKPYLLEEVHEVIEAIENKTPADIAEELGDMLLHIVMLSTFAQEKKQFNIDTVIKQISAKMIRRHPHVFGQGTAKTKEEVWAKWKEIKREEKRGSHQQRNRQTESRKQKAESS